MQINTMEIKRVIHIVIIHPNSNRFVCFFQRYFVNFTVGILHYDLIKCCCFFRIAQDHDHLNQVLTEVYISAFDKFHMYCLLTFLQH